MKAFTTYKFDTLPTLEDSQLAEYSVKDPTGTQWRTMGIEPHYTLYADEVANGQIVCNIPSVNAQSIVVVITERILPSASIKRHIAKLEEQFEAEHGQKVTRKQRAELTEEYINETLPHCPLKETRAEVTIDAKERVVYVATSSQKTADDVTAFLLRILTESNQSPDLSLYRPVKTPYWLSRQLMEGDLGYGSCKLLNTVTGKKISFTKDYDLDSARTLKNETIGVSVVELGIKIPECCTFVLTDKAVVKGLKIAVPETNEEDEDGDKTAAVADYLLCLQANRRIVSLFAEMEKDDADDDL